MALRRSFLLFALTALALGACSTNVIPPVDVPVVPTDVPTTPDVQTTPDVPTDTAPMADRLTFGPCRTNADCPDGDTCYTDAQGYAGGFCSRTCTTNSQCDPHQDGVDGTCRMVGTARLCMRVCMNGFGCERTAYTCAPVTTTTGVCISSCDATSCGAGTRCNAWTARCEPVTAPDPPPGSPNGAPCTQSGTGSQCRSSACIVAASAAGVFSGWNNGTCISNCRLPFGYNVGNLWAPSNELPQGNCPASSICFPNGEGYAEQDYGVCLSACRADTDCRQADGMYCRRTFTVGRTMMRTFDNGYCAPMDCRQAGRTCPAGLMCEVQNRGTAASPVLVGVCRPATPMPDVVGTDAVVDVPTDTATGTDVPADTTSPTDVTTPDDAGLDVAPE